MTGRESLLSPLRRRGRRAAVATGGTATVLLGVVLLPLPGPGTVVILAGLTVLQKEFPKAGRVRDRIIGTAKRSVSWLRRRSGDGAAST